MTHLCHGIKPRPAKDSRQRPFTQRLQAVASPQQAEGWEHVPSEAEQGSRCLGGPVGGEKGKAAGI